MIILVPAVPVHGVDEKETEYLDPLRTQAFFLVQVLPDGPADHLALYGGGVHVPVVLSRSQKPLLARDLEFDELFPWLDADVTDAEVPVDGAAGSLFKVVAVHDVLFLASDPAGGLHVEFDPGGDRPAIVVRVEQSNVWLVVSVLDHGGRYFDLLHQLALVGVHGIEPVDHVALIDVRRRIAQGTKRVHRFQRFFSSSVQPPVDALRLIDDQHGRGGTDQIDRLLAPRLLTVLVKIVDVLLVNGAYGHHHDLDLGAGGEIPHLAELGGVVEEVVEGRSGVERPEVVLGDLERLVHAFL